MSIRTFKQLGQAYGPIPATIVAKIDGVEVFSGEILTVNQPLPSLPSESPDVTNALFSWTKDTSFSGAINLEITVEGSPVLLTDSRANYPIDAPEYADEYNIFYSYKIDETIYFDPFNDEKIDGISVSRVDDPLLPGQWYWTIMPGSTFSATVNIQSSLPPPPPSPAA